MRIIWTSLNEMYRITEVPYFDETLENLKGDCYNPKHNPSIDPKQLRLEETRFETLIETEGVYGYVLEHWDARPDKGWTHIESCWGFVGQYDAKSDEFNHYIVDQLKKGAS